MMVKCGSHIDGLVQERHNSMLTNWSFVFLALTHQYVCLWQKQVSRGGASNYISQILWDVITCPCPWYLLLAQHTSYMTYMSLSWRLNLLCCYLNVLVPHAVFLPAPAAYYSVSSTPMPPSHATWQYDASIRASEPLFLPPQCHITLGARDIDLHNDNTGSDGIVFMTPTSHINPFRSPPTQCMLHSRLHTFPSLKLLSAIIRDGTCFKIVSSMYRDSHKNMNTVITAVQVNGMEYSYTCLLNLNLKRWLILSDSVWGSLIISIYKSLITCLLQRVGNELYSLTSCCRQDFTNRREFSQSVLQRMIELGYPKIIYESIFLNLSMKLAS